MVVVQVKRRNAARFISCFATPSSLRRSNAVLGQHFGDDNCGLTVLCDAVRGKQRMP